MLQTYIEQEYIGCRRPNLLQCQRVNVYILDWMVSREMFIRAGCEPPRLVTMRDRNVIEMGDHGGCSIMTTEEGNFVKNILSSSVIERKAWGY